MTLLINNIKLEKYRKEDKIAQIDLLLVQDKITLDQYNELLELIDQYADPDYQPPKTTENRVGELEYTVSTQQHRQDITEQAVQDLWEVSNMAEFLAYRILDGKLEFAEVPKALKEAVKKILSESGRPELAE